MKQGMRRLGQTEIEVTPIGLGVLQFAGGRSIFKLMHKKLSSKKMTDIVKAAFNGGINWFDTAEVYGSGYSERSLATAIKAVGRQDCDVIIATKWFPLFRTASSIAKTIDKRLSNLDGFTIDLHQVHLPLSFSTVEAQMNTMADMVGARKIRSIGVSNFSATNMKKAHAALSKHGLPLASNQVSYSLTNREIENNGILETAKELGISIIAYAPLASGLLTGKFHSNSEILNKTPLLRRVSLRSRLDKSRQLIITLQKLAEIHNATAAQIALSWLINYHGDTVIAIPGASDAHHAKINAAAMDINLTEPEMAEINYLSKLFI